MAAAQMESLEELQAKLATYQEQQQQVDAYLLAEPSNEQYLQLKQDLLEIIALTVDLIKTSLAAPPPPPPPPPQPPTSSSSPPLAAQANGHADDEDDDDDDDGYGSGGDGVTGKNHGGPDDKEDPFGVESVVLVLAGEKWLPAWIKAKAEDGQIFTVGFLGHDVERVVNITSLKQIHPQPRGLTPLAAETIIGSTQCQALYHGDGLYYDSTIDDVTKFGYKVTFPEYGNTEVVPFEWLRRKGGVATEAEDAPGIITINNRKVNLNIPAAALDEEGNFKVPDNLKIMPGDTEAEQERKRKKVKQLKARYRLKQKDEATKSKQSSWQAFAKGAVKGKKKGGAVKGMRKESIFKTPDNPDGKVGVTGSGAGMTEFQARKKYKLGS